MQFSTDEWGNSIKNRLKFLFRRVPGSYTVLDMCRSLKPGYRELQRKEKEQLQTWLASVGDTFRKPLSSQTKGRVLILGWAGFHHILLESVVRKSFELAGYEAHVLTDVTPTIRQTYAAMGVRHVSSLSRFCPLPERRLARQLIRELDTCDQLLGLEWKGVAVGKYVASTVMRFFRKESLDLADSVIRETVERHLANSLAYVAGAQRFLKRTMPAVAVFPERAYSPYGELFDACINSSIPCFTWNVGHRDNLIVMKRFTAMNCGKHYLALSGESWRKLKGMPWNDEMAATIQDELRECYLSGEWYSEVGTQFGKTNLEDNTIRYQLGLDTQKKTAVIFAHMFWDATFFWGKDLFSDYKEWLVETVKGACANDRLNWIIKVHPANVIKDARDGFAGESLEIQALSKNIGKLPNHVKILPADSEFNTLSLFPVMDYCLTVRGTIGIEAALFGKTVLTAGTGRYDRLGFTLDFESKENYLQALSHLEDTPPPTPQMIELAQRYGYGVFLCRPVPLRMMRMGFVHDKKASLEVDIQVKSFDELKASGDLNQIASWIESGDEDMLNWPLQRFDVRKDNGSISLKKAD